MRLHLASSLASSLLAIVANTQADPAAASSIRLGRAVSAQHRALPQQSMGGRPQASLRSKAAVRALSLEDRVGPQRGLELHDDAHDDLAPLQLSKYDLKLKRSAAAPPRADRAWVGERNLAAAKPVPFPFKVGGDEKSQLTRPSSRKLETWTPDGATLPIRGGAKEPKILPIESEALTTGVVEMKNSASTAFKSLLTRNLQSELVWEQLGSDIDGEAEGDSSGIDIAMSEDGLTVAIGAHYNNGNTGVESTGHVRVYRYISNGWSQLGNDIDGDVFEGKGMGFGQAVAMSEDGLTVAIGVPNYDIAGPGTAWGQVRVFRYTDDDWSEMGNGIMGDAPSDYAFKVAMSADGSTIAIGAEGNDANGNNSGHVRVFRYISNAWSQMGNDINGEAAYDMSGRSIALSENGSTLAIGAHGNDANGSSSGHVRVYQHINNDWNKMGNDLDGEAAGDSFGFSVAMSSDGLTVAIGAPYNDGSANQAGRVRMYRYNDNVWNKLGNDIDGESAMVAFGYSVAISSDGLTVAIAAINISDASKPGHVRVYRYIEDVWNQMGNDIYSETACYVYGRGLAMSADGATVGIADGCSPAGHVEVYKLMLPTPSNIWTLDLQDTSATLATDAEDDITFSYLMAAGRDYETSLREKGCAKDDEVDETLYSVTKNTDVYNSTHQWLNVSYILDNAALASSRIWDNVTSTIELCQVTELTTDSGDPTLGNLTVAQSITKLEVTVNSVANFTIKANLTGETIFNETEEVDAAAAVRAFKCDAEFEENNEPLSPNTELLTCIGSKDDAFNVDTVDRMTITQSGKNPMTVINEGDIQIPSITSTEIRAKGIVVRSRIPINLFDFEEGKILTIEGAVTMKLADGSSRRLSVKAGSVVRDLQDESNEASYTVDVALEAAEESAVDLSNNADRVAAAGHAAFGLKGFAIAAFFLLL